MGRFLSCFWRDSYRQVGSKEHPILIGVLYFISALGSGLAMDPYSFSLFRFLGGLGVGASTVAAPIYITEIAPYKQRGRMVAMYQFNIVFGILIAFLSNMLINQYIEVNAWRWMLGIEALPALVYALLVLTIPKSPRWLYLFKKNKTEAAKVLLKMNPNINTEQQFLEMKTIHESSKSSVSIWQKKYMKLVSLAFLLPFLIRSRGLMHSCIMQIEYLKVLDCPKVLFLSGIGLGLINLFFTLLGVALIDKVGRKS